MDKDLMAKKLHHFQKLFFVGLLGSFHELR